VVSLSAFAYVFSEIVQYHQSRVDSISELERRLESTGFAVGLRVLELLAVRSKEYRRETKLMNLLQFISTTVWKNLFGKPADSLERSIDHADEFMIIDYAPITRYVYDDVLHLPWTPFPCGLPSHTDEFFPASHRRRLFVVCWISISMMLSPVCRSVRIVVART
jgi:hypothetical protein